MHLKVLRLFVESVLRYGLPANYTGLVIKVGRYLLREDFHRTIMLVAKPKILEENAGTAPGSLYLPRATVWTSCGGKRVRWA